MISAAEPEKRFITVRSKRMAYVEMGTGDPIVFQHGKVSEFAGFDRANFGQRPVEKETGQNFIIRQDRNRQSRFWRLEHIQGVLR